MKRLQILVTLVAGFFGSHIYAADVCPNTFKEEARIKLDTAVFVDCGGATPQSKLLKSANHSLIACVNNSLDALLFVEEKGSGNTQLFAICKSGLILSPSEQSK